MYIFSGVPDFDRQKNGQQELFGQEFGVGGNLGIYINYLFR